jgi:hypothetical protein
MIADKGKTAPEALLELALEGWRFQKLFGRAIQKMDAGEGLRFANQHRYFVRKIGECLQDAGMQFVSLEGEIYTAGHPVSAVNIADFGPDDDLVIDQMVEPIVMGEAGVLRAGTVTLRKARP